MKTILSILVLIACSLSVDAQRPLTTDERQSLTESQEFREQCYWAISNYATYWKARPVGDFKSSDATLYKWQKEYSLVQQVAKADYNDASLAIRFVTLSKGMDFAVDSDPTTEEIIALFISGNKFEELAGLYFQLLTE